MLSHFPYPLNLVLALAQWKSYCKNMSPYIPPIIWFEYDRPQDVGIAIFRNKELDDITVKLSKSKMCLNTGYG